MKFGTIFLWGDDYQAYVRRLRMADELGFDWIGIGDSQSVYRELYVALAVAAQHTSRALLGPLVTNPVTRHPAITASGMASVDELSRGRALIGIGTGGSAVLNIGETMATQAAIREYVIALRGLLRGETVQWRGKPVHTKWIRRPVPVLLAAYGAKSLRLAGEIADGVIIASSSHPDVLGECLKLVHEGARGRTQARGAGDMGHGARFGARYARRGDRRHQPASSGSSFRPWTAIRKTPCGALRWRFSRNFARARGLGWCSRRRGTPFVAVS